MPEANLWTAIFTRIWRSSIMRQDDLTVLTFLFLVTNSDDEGYFYGTRESIAGMMQRGYQEVCNALETLCNTDPNDSSGIADGRRVIEESPNQWLVVNKRAYKEAMKLQSRREQTRKRVQKFREKGQENGSNAIETPCNAPSQELDKNKNKSKTEGAARTRTFSRADFIDEEWSLLKKLRVLIGNTHDKKMPLPSQRELRHFNKILYYPLTEIRSVIEWALSDTEADVNGFCWAAQVQSIPTKKKFENIRGQWRAIALPKQKKEEQKAKEQGVIKQQMQRVRCETEGEGGAVHISEILKPQLEGVQE